MPALRTSSEAAEPVWPGAGCSGIMTLDCQASTRTDDLAAAQRYRLSARESAHLGRALLYVHRHTPLITDAVLKAKLGQLIAAGEAMDYAVKLKDHGRYRRQPLKGVAHGHAQPTRRTRVNRVGTTRYPPMPLSTGSDTETSHVHVGMVTPAEPSS